MRNIPIVTKNLLIVNIVAFLITYILGKDASGGYVLMISWDSISLWHLIFRCIN